ncbi:glycosyltransferase [Pantoea vagans]|uniref:glycosyltransferase n=2 Tax=Erwiniaceae TaxID=1903409 RepID=UPI0001E09BDE|nr:glycosyltransferase [Pantoea sp. MT58]AWP31178.1 glycosyltransferase [Pantoea vagans]EFM17846.1 glycosyl transferase family 2 [Pantoea sp. aB]QNQ58815.1 glycosyltransferase [Pantoea sp. MT58]SKA24120.1 heptose III glucuronosyltransferase [Pantoea eucalypti]
MIYDEATPFRSEYNAGADIVMSTSPLLSIITPMYNAGSMFDEFMQALLAQTLTMLEIIIVDDGSTDGSGERADQYAQQHAHIRVIHQENGGVSRARNAGLAIARGKYVTFPDADDTMQPDMYQTLVTLAEADNLDAAQCNAEWFFKHSQRVKPLIPLDRLRSTPVLSGADWLNTALKTHRYMHVVWLGIYRRELIEQHQLQFEPGLHHQDIPWTTEFMLLAKRVRYTEAVLYRYYMHDASISNRKRTGERNVEYQRHYLKIARLLEELNHRYRDRVKIYPSFHYQVTHEALSVCHSVRREPDPRARQAIIADLFTTRTHLRMLRNARGIKQWYQLLLWLARLYRWRNK